MSIEIGFVMEPLLMKESSKRRDELTVSRQTKIKTAARKIVLSTERVSSLERCELARSILSLTVAPAKRPISLQIIKCLNLLLHIFGPLYALPDILFILKTGLTGECFVQVSLEVWITLRVILAQVQELFVDVDYFSTQSWVSHLTM